MSKARPQSITRQIKRGHLIWATDMNGNKMLFPKWHPRAKRAMSQNYKLVAHDLPTVNNKTEGFEDKTPWYTKLFNKAKNKLGL